VAGVSVEPLFRGDLSISSRGESDVPCRRISTRGPKRDLPTDKLSRVAERKESKFLACRFLRFRCEQREGIYFTIQWQRERSSFKTSTSQMVGKCGRSESQQSFTITRGMPAAT
jgi:hypothetical protein